MDAGEQDEVARLMQAIEEAAGKEEGKAEETADEQGGRRQGE